MKLTIVVKTVAHDVISCGAKIFAMIGVATAISLLLPVHGSAVWAEDAKPLAKLAPELEARMAAEKAARLACKKEICAVFASRKGDASPIKCNVTKTWLRDEIQQNYLGNKLSWPWGHTQCTAAIELDRNAIAKLVAEPEATMKLKQHDIRCTIDPKENGSGEASKIEFSITPTVNFKDGKATKVIMGWGKVTASTLFKSAIWSATGVDNTFNVIGSRVANEINSFVYRKCGDVGVPVTKP